jgi:putative hydrolase of the HAD superfamily
MAGIPHILAGYNTSMRINTIFFDLDETLYPASTGLWAVIGERINTYLHERMGIPADETQTLRERFFREYGTTLRGLQVNFKVNMEDYLAFVHDVPLDHYLRPDPELRKIISTLPARKFIFTNSDRAHAGRVLNVLGLQGIFDGILDVHTLAPYCKPMRESFEMALQAAGSPDWQDCALLDDQARITQAARSLGMYTVLVGKPLTDGKADAALDNWADLPALLEARI